MKDKKSQIRELLLYFYLVFSFGILDVWLRVMTRWINAYSIYAPAPNLFTLLWSVILASMIIILPKKIGGVIYAVLYALFLIYAVVQYGAYLILGKFLFISDFLYAGEGMDFFSYAIGILTPLLIVQVVLLIIVGIIGMLALVRIQGLDDVIWKKCCYLGIICVGAAGLNMVPALYGKVGDSTRWDNFYDPAAEYARFINSNFDLELTGMYQYIVRDAEEQVARSRYQVDMADVQRIKEHFLTKQEHQRNEMTGIFQGKNLLVFMLESTDDWLINEEDTPTIYRMMKNGINFSNMFTPGYSNGYTFNTEFAFNTSVYPYTNGNVAYTLANNSFDSSLANAFSQGGYDANSFHEGLSSFYNRGEMHESFGYKRYYSYSEYPEIGITVLDDTFLIKNGELYRRLTENKPFYSYVITYGGHLPYSTEDDEHARHAISVHPEYDVQTDREIAVLRAKVRLTDDMFKGLLESLEESGLLSDTVIVGFADHYAYGLTDKEMLQRVSEEAGSTILERTPAFIYCADWDQPMTVDKVMQTTDLAPTIMNLFGFEVPKDIMGQDVFDENYPGFAIFPNNTWLTSEAYMKSGVLQWNNGMTSEEIAQMNEYVQKAYQINDLILDTDYYRNKNK